MIRCVCLCEWDFFNENHKYLAIRQEVFGNPPLFFIGGSKGPAFLEWFYAQKVVGVDGTEKWLRLGSLEEFVPFRCPSLHDQVESAERWGKLGSFRLLLVGKLISAENVGEVVREQDPFSKLYVILVEN
jgi:hypothetical protein